MQGSSSVAASAAEARLADALFAVKNAVEDRDIARLRGLFTDRPQICIQGRFLTLAVFLERLAEFFARVEHISMDVTRIEEVDEKEGFIAARVDFGWIDSTLWEEQQMHGLVGLTLAAPRQQAARTQQRARTTAGEPVMRISGFSYNALPRDGEGGLEPGDERPPRDQIGPRPAADRGGGYGIWF
jgi:hypothetical protein